MLFLPSFFFFFPCIYNPDRLVKHHIGGTTSSVWQAVRLRLYLKVRVATSWLQLLYGLHGSLRVNYI